MRDPLGPDASSSDEADARERLLQIHAVTGALSEAVHPADVARVVTHEMVTVLGAAQALLAIPNEAETELTLLGHVGLRGPEAFERFSVDASLPVAEAFRTGEAVWLSSRNDAVARFSGLVSERDRQTEAMVAVPLVMGGRRLGAIGFGFHERHAFNGPERTLVENMARKAAIVLDRARLYDAERRARREVEARHRELTHLLVLAEGANRATSLEKVYPPALDSVCSALEVDRASILLVDPDGVMRFKAWRGLSDEYRQRAEGHTAWAPDDPDPQPVLVPDVEQAPHLESLREPLRTEGIRGLGFFPLRTGSRLLGKFMVYTAGPRTFSEREVQLAQAIGTQLTQAVLRAEVLEGERQARAEAERNADRIHLLQRITVELSRAVDANDVARVVVDEGSSAIGALSGGLWLVDEKDRLKLVASRGYERAGELIEEMALSPEIPVADAVLRGEPVWLMDRPSYAERNPDFAARIRDLRPESAEATACLPLILEARAVGVLAFTFESSRVLDFEDREMLLAMARQCAQGLERARLYEAERHARAQAEDAARRATFLADAGRALATSLDADATLRKVAELAVPAVADWCVVELTDPDSHAITSQVALVHRDPQKLELGRKLTERSGVFLGEDDALGRVLRTGEALLVEELCSGGLAAFARDGEHRRQLERLALRSAMIVPIPRGEKVVGVIGFATSESGRRFHQADLEMALELGRRAGLALENSKLFEAARSASRAREDILAVVSHDLRNPLSAVMMSVDAMRRQPLEGPAAPRLLRGFDAIQRATDRMTRLIGDLLDFASLQSGRLKLIPALHTPQEIVEAAAEMFEGVATQRGIWLETQVAPDLPVLRCDRERTVQALSNLLSNSVKVTEPGGHVIVGAERRGRDVVFEVRDTGPGVSAEELPHIFERYWRGDRTGYRGTGLGLAIARGIVETRGGWISAQSTLGEGSSFSFGLPLAG